MENKYITKRLEKLLLDEPRLQKNGNWVSPMVGRTGIYYLYSLIYVDNSIRYGNLVGSHQNIYIKFYPEKRDKGKYSVLANGSSEFNGLNEVIRKIKRLLPPK